MNPSLAKVLSSYLEEVQQYGQHRSGRTAHILVGNDTKGQQIWWKVLTSLNSPAIGGSAEILPAGHESDWQEMFFRQLVAHLFFVPEM